MGQPARRCHLARQPALSAAVKRRWIALCPPGPGVGAPRAALTGSSLSAGACISLWHSRPTGQAFLLQPPPHRPLPGGGLLGHLINTRTGNGLRKLTSNELEEFMTRAKKRQRHKVSKTNDFMSAEKARVTELNHGNPSMLAWKPRPRLLCPGPAPNPARPRLLVSRDTAISQTPLRCGRTS